MINTNAVIYNLETLGSLKMPFTYRKDENLQPNMKKKAQKAQWRKIVKTLSQNPSKLMDIVPTPRVSGFTERSKSREN
mgnify:FL=1